MMANKSCDHHSTFIHVVCIKLGENKLALNKIKQIEHTTRHLANKIYWLKKKIVRHILLNLACESGEASE